LRAGRVAEEFTGRMCQDAEPVDCLIRVRPNWVDVVAAVDVARRTKGFAGRNGSCGIEAACCHGIGRLVRRAPTPP
jgi:hypothetical protein